MIFGINTTHDGLLTPDSWYFRTVSNFTRLTAREITYNNFEISLLVFMPNITTNHAIAYKLLVPDSKWMVTLNIVTTIYPCCLISRPYSCLFDNSLCSFNLWITLGKILLNWPLVCSFWPCGPVVWSHLYKTRTCTQFPHHIEWVINPFAPEPNVPCTACDVISFNIVILVQGKKSFKP